MASKGSSQAVTPNPSVKGTSTSGLRPLAAAPYLERYASVVTGLEIVRQCVESACALGVLRALAVVVSVEAFRQPERHRRGLHRLSEQYLVRLPCAQLPAWVFSERLA